MRPWESRRCSSVSSSAQKEGKFPENSLTTAFVDYKTKLVNVGKIPVSVELWDTAGQEKYAAISSIYYKGAEFVVLVYDLNNPVP